MQRQGSALVVTDRTAQISANVGQIANPTSFAEDALGNLYIMDLGGDVYKLTPNVLSADGNDVLNGNGGSDTIYGGSGNDAISGGDGNDLLYGGPGDDQLFGGIGNNLMVGGPGDDTFHSEGGSDLITIARHGDGTTTVSDPIHSDTLFGVEHLAFSDKTIDVASLPITPETLGHPVFRFFDTHDGGHFFTTSATERNQVYTAPEDMNFEGVGYNAVDPATADPNAAPVFRFFDTHDGGHFFTISTAERDQVRCYP